MIGTATDALLSVEHVTVSFDGFKALNDLSFSLAAGACHVLVGPNGAGKSTLLDTIIGRVHPTSGRIMFKGADLANVPEYAIVRRGICRKFQTPGVLDALTIEDNLRVAVTRNRGAWHALIAATTAAEKARIDEVLEIIGLGAPPPRSRGRARARQQAVARDRHGRGIRCRSLTARRTRRGHDASRSGGDGDVDPFAYRAARVYRDRSR